MMRNVLEQEFGCEVKWAETASRNTYENALFSAAILKESDVKNIYLVTHALDMRRALWAFKQQGLSVFPAPTVFLGEKEINASLSSFLPSAQAVYRNAHVFHETVGTIWYYIRY